MRASTDCKRGNGDDRHGTPERAPWCKPSYQMFETSVRESPLCGIARLRFEDLRRLEQEARLKRAEAVADATLWLVQTPARILWRLAAAWQNGAWPWRNRFRPMP